MYKAVRSERLYEQIVEQIEQRIIKGELNVGDQLPPERELGLQFGVSRTAVREAIRALHEKGLVQIQPGRGTFIANGTPQAVRQSLKLMVRIGSGENLENLEEVREIVEPEIAALAALRANDEHIAAMREAVSAMDAALGDPEPFVEADLDFHLALAEATQNPLIPTLIDSIIDLLREQRIRIFLNDGPVRGQYHHRRILEAVVRREPEAAREAMRAHLRQVRQDSRPAETRAESAERSS